MSIIGEFCNIFRSGYFFIIVEKISRSNLKLFCLWHFKKQFELFAFCRLTQKGGKLVLGERKVRGCRLSVGGVFLPKLFYFITDFY